MKKISTVTKNRERDFERTQARHWFGSGRSNESLLHLWVRQVKGSWNRRESTGLFHPGRPRAFPR